MTQEEKARAYDKVSKEVKDFFEGKQKMYSDVNQTLEYLFPELKESEDEKVRKEIITYLKSDLSHKTYGDKSIESWISWLEKQKDCIKLSNSVYTSNKDIIKFADKYSHTVWENLIDKFKKIENYSIGCNDVSDIVLNAIINTYNWLEKQSEKKHKFNIGDIISNGQAVFRVENITKNCIGQDCYFLVNVEDEKKGLRYLILTDSHGNHSHFGEITWLCEQVDKLFEKKELKKISQRMVSAEAKEAMYDKSAWSEEDDAYKLFAISAVEDYYDEKNPLQKVLVDWLKSLKQRVKG